MSKPIPIYLIARFMGSGKTTLLNHTLDYVKECGKKPAVIMRSYRLRWASSSLSKTKFNRNRC
jgi:molybdopterin-guanine dinucleotide biosynthesis protein